MMFRRDSGPDEDEALEPEDDDWEDDLLPHGGLWSRPVGEDALRCAEHGLTVDEHSWLDQLDRDLER